MSVGYGAYIEKQARKSGRAEGREEAIKEMRLEASQKSDKVVMNMISNGRLTEEEIASVADVSLEKVKELKNKMNQKK